MTSSSRRATLGDNNKLNKPTEFRRIFSSGQRTADKNFLFVYKTNNKSVARLGLAISKRQIPKSVDRNRYKRVIREAFRLNKNELKGIDLVVQARIPIKNLSYKRFEKTLNENLKRILQCKES